MLVDANLLIYAIDRQAARHEVATRWLAEQLNGPRRVGLPWQSITAFLRIVTHPRAYAKPLGPDAAWQQVLDWLAAPVAWIPEPGPEHGRILGQLITGYGIRGNLIPDASLAALAIEHGLTLYSHDTDFARFRELRWENPLDR
jgi:uncharacterized protein